MEKELFDFVAERADVLAASEASKQETKDAALAWKSAVEGADDEAIEAATTKFIDFLEGRPNTVDGVIAFAQGPAVEMFGKETAGLPEELLRDNPQTTVRIPMISEARSLNLSNSVALGVYEALRQWDYPALQGQGQLTKYQW